MVLLGDCDTGVARVCGLCGWGEELEELVKKAQGGVATPNQDTCQHQHSHGHKH